MEENTNKYQHTQVGRLMLMTFALVALMFWFILSQADYDLLTLVAMIFVLIIVASFASLNVVITDKYLKIKFGYGIFRKKFLLNE